MRTLPAVLALKPLLLVSAPAATRTISYILILFEARFGAALVSTGVLAETGPGHVSHTSNSLVYATKGPMSALICVGYVSYRFYFHILSFSYDGHLKTLAVLLKYFDEFGLREPIGKTGTVFAYACGDATKSVWDHCNSDQEYKENFMLCMVAMASKTPTAGSYDYSWVTAKGETEPSRTLVVDVGGGHGHALRDIATATPGLSLGRCAVEDLAPVVEEAKRTAAGGLEKAQFVTMDFHAEQPIKEAVVYYIRRCLHDYGDDDCVDILSQIAGAMAKDSRLLIVEQVLREPLAAVPVANDIIMALIGGKERTEEGFRAIAGRAGLEIAGVHRSEGTEFAVVECKLV